MIVADTNVVAYLLLEGPRTAACEAVLQKDPAWALPSLWRHEIANVLVTNVRHGVVTLSRALALLRAAEESFGAAVGSSRVDLQACKLEYSIVSPK